MTVKKTIRQSEKLAKWQAKKQKEWNRDVKRTQKQTEKAAEREAAALRRLLKTSAGRNWENLLKRNTWKRARDKQTFRENRKSYKRKNWKHRVPMAELFRTLVGSKRSPDAKKASKNVLLRNLSNSLFGSSEVEEVKKKRFKKKVDALYGDLMTNTFGLGDFSGTDVGYLGKTKKELKLIKATSNNFKRNINKRTNKWTNTTFDKWMSSGKGFSAWNPNAVPERKKQLSKLDKVRDQWLKKMRVYIDRLQKGDVYFKSQ